MKNVMVIGAGLSGLSCAWELQRRGVEVTVLESTERVGGSIRSHWENGVGLEAGPNTLMANDSRLSQCFRDLGIESEVVEAGAQSKKRFLARAGAFHPVPMSPAGFWNTPLLSRGGKWRLLREPFVRARKGDDEESLADFIRRRLGPEALERLVQPVISGIYAGDPERLTIEGAFPLLARLEDEHGSIVKGMLKRKKSPHAEKRRLLSFRKGLSVLPEAMARDLGDALHLNARVEAIEPGPEGEWKVRWSSGGKGDERTGALVLAVPAWALRHLPLPVELLTSLEPVMDVEHPPLVSVSCLLDRSAIGHPLDGFGGLIPATEEQSVLGILFISTLFPERCPTGKVLLTSFLGGRRTPADAEGTDAVILEKVMKACKRYLGATGSPDQHWIFRWPRSIPQPEGGHRDRMKRLDQLENQTSGLYFAGNYRTGVSLSQCLLGGLSLAERMVEAVFDEKNTEA